MCSQSKIPIHIEVSGHDQLCLSAVDQSQPIRPWIYSIYDLIRSSICYQASVWELISFSIRASDRYILVSIILPTTLACYVQYLTYQQARVLYRSTPQQTRHETFVTVSAENQHSRCQRCIYPQSIVIRNTPLNYPHKTHQSLRIIVGTG